MDLSIPDGVTRFLATAGWTGVTVDPLPGDASFRRYFASVRAQARRPC
jgi:hypothetical protein